MWQCRRCKRCRFYPLVRKIPWSRKWQPSSVFLFENFQGDRSLAGSCPWSNKKLDMTKWLSTCTCAHTCAHTHTHTHTLLFVCACMLHRFSHARLFADPMDCSPPGSSVHGFLQAGILEWVAMPSFRGSFWPRNRTCFSCNSCIVGRFFTAEPPGKHTLVFFGCYTPHKKSLDDTPISRWENENEKGQWKFYGKEEFWPQRSLKWLTDKPRIEITI